MTIQLKDFYSNQYIEHICSCLSDIIQRPIANQLQEQILTPSWQDMPLKTRMQHLTSVLETVFNEHAYSYQQSINILKKLLVLVSTPQFKYSDMLAMFIPDYVARHTQESWELSMNALKYFTSHGTSSEFAIRPFILNDQDKAFSYITQWANDEHPHIRRFASEGCRPRLPWSFALPALKEDPTPLFPILKTLIQDSQLYVKKSVANNLNDISKDHPEQALDFSQRHHYHNEHSRWIVKHGLRTLLKKSHHDALAMFGHTHTTVNNPTLTIKSTEISMGDKLNFTFNGTISSTLPDKLRLEYQIDYLKKNGSYTHKRYKIGEYTPTTTDININTSHNFKLLSTRTYYPGAHHMHIYINGQCVASNPFYLK